MVNWKLLGVAALIGAGISLISGIIGGNPFGVVVLRLLVSALLFAAIGFGASFLIARFLLDLAGAGPSADGRVDVVIPEENPHAAAHEDTLAPSPDGVIEVAAGEEEEAPLPRTSSTDASPLTPDGPDEQVIAEEAELAAPSTGVPAADAELETLEEAEVAVLPGVQAEAQEESGEKEEPGLLPEQEDESLPTMDEFDSGIYTSTAKPASPAQAQVAEIMDEQDPSTLAKAVRTFLKKDQEG